MGAPAKTKRINVRLSPDERAAIGRRARSAGLSVSEYLRRVALQDSDRPVIRTDADLLKRIHANLKRAGGNLNQCSRELHLHHRPNDIEAELELALKAVAAASAEVAEFIRDARDSI